MAETSSAASFARCNGRPWGAPRHVWKKRFPGKVREPGPFHQATRMLPVILMTWRGLCRVGGFPVRFVVPLLLVGLVTPWLPAQADPAPAGLLWKSARDGSWAGWTGSFTVDAAGRLVPTWLAEVRSPPLPEGTLEVTVLARGRGEVRALDEVGSELLSVRLGSDGACVKGECVNAMPAVVTALGLRIAQDGWSVSVDGRPFLEGSADLGDLRFVAAECCVGLVDVRAYGSGPFFDEPLWYGLGPLEMRSGLPLTPLGEAWRLQPGHGLVFENTAMQDVRPHAVMPTPTGAWAFGAETAVIGSGGYSVLAGLAPDGTTLWSLSLCQAFLDGSWSLELTEGSTSRRIGPLATGSSSGWSGVISALGDPATGVMSLRVRHEVFEVQLDGLDGTSSVAFGDVHLTPVLACGQLRDGSVGWASHAHVFVASAHSDLRI